MPFHRVQLEFYVQQKPMSLVCSQLQTFVVGCSSFGMTRTRHGQCRGQSHLKEWVFVRGKYANNMLKSYRVPKALPCKGSQTNPFKKGPFSYQLQTINSQGNVFLTRCKQFLCKISHARVKIQVQDKPHITHPFYTKFRF